MGKWLRYPAWAIVAAGAVYAAGTGVHVLALKGSVALPDGAMRMLAHLTNRNLVQEINAYLPRVPAMSRFEGTPLFTVRFAADASTDIGARFGDFLGELTLIRKLPDGSEDCDVFIDADRDRQWMTVRLQNPFNSEREDEIRVEIQMAGNRYPSPPSRITFVIRGFQSSRTGLPPEDVVEKVMEILGPGLRTAAERAAHDAGGLTVT